MHVVNLYRAYKLNVPIHNQSEVSVTFHYSFRLYLRSLIIVLFLLQIALITGCSTIVGVQENNQMPLLSATITEIDDHGNAVTDLQNKVFHERGWELGDILEVTFENEKQIRIKFVENYGDVPEGEYLGRFSTSTQRFKIAINHGNLAKTLSLQSPSKVKLRKVQD